MKKLILVIVFAVVSVFVQQASAADFSYAAIAERFNETSLDSVEVEKAKMHGECMVGLKRLIFIKRTDFDPVAEWINYRTISLLEQFPPCNVLVMMQVARAELMGEVKP